MKKIISLILFAALLCGTVVAFASCGGKCETCVDENFDDVCDVCDTEYVSATKGIDFTNFCRANSLPTSIVTTSSQIFRDSQGGVLYTLNQNSTLVTGKINGKIATVYTYAEDHLQTIASGSTSLIKPVINTITGSDEFLQGSGRRINGGNWQEGYNFAPAQGSIAVEVDLSKINSNWTYTEAEYNNTIRFIIPKANAKEVLGADFYTDSAVTVEITNNGAVITSVKVSYVVLEYDNDPRRDVSIEIQYGYGAQNVQLVK